ncbi:hypothetical protein SAMD00019534_059090 [Acytostelium subglobosum LB1]|uniref:hypothetical protein n=1 Tax=Acytostelium subglobosum LB1 TaxID=1410327 RepID=UPI0006450127|nr:hypothetical protein SAMD00019534_059090 [Acytostelium subglobosum LB1]GAM22734.1 hypothetical protein SAMD00019534_059090 [Acytostelium subglobosum LB1]|eukprot:XP_012753961.1 hypothetical protein SAMD00019534_059090 [Acytostelium subglobosum LB1]
MRVLNKTSSNNTTNINNDVIYQYLDGLVNRLAGINEASSSPILSSNVIRIRLINYILDRLSRTKSNTEQIYNKLMSISHSIDDPVVLRKMAKFSNRVMVDVYERGIKDKTIELLSDTDKFIQDITESFNIDYVLDNNDDGDNGPIEPSIMRMIINNKEQSNIILSRYNNKQLDEIMREMVLLARCPNISSVINLKHHSHLAINPK